VLASPELADLGEVNMSDPATLVDFVTWAVQNYPADRYMLIMSDHGAGWPGGWSDPAPAVNPKNKAPLAEGMGNMMYLDELGDGLAEIQSKTGIDKLDLIGFDACLMAQIEVMSAVAPYARYAVVSEETEPSLGWAYTAFLQKLTEDPSLSTADLARAIVDTYIVDDQRILDDNARAKFADDKDATASSIIKEVGQDITLTAVDLSAIPDVVGALDDLHQSKDRGQGAQVCPVL
jgi:Clostripain family